MTARTPGPWWIDDDGFLVRMDDETESAYDLNDAAALLNSHEANHDTLTAQVAVLAEALRETVRIVEHTVLHGNVFGFDGGAVQDIATKARAALVKAGAR